MSIRGHRIGRALAATAVGGALLGAVTIGTAAPAGATEGSIDHFCGSLRLPDDNGPVTDVLHHVLEDPVRPLGLSYLAHGQLCRVAGVEQQVLQLLAPRT